MKTKTSLEEVMTGSPKKPVVIKFPLGLWERVGKYAEKRKTTRTAVVIVAVDKYLEEQR